MTRPGVAEDLREVAVADAFGILSLYVAGPGELRRYSGGGLLQTDDRTALEFSAPRAMNRSDGAANATTLAGLLGNSDAGSERTRPTSGGPETIVRVLSGATAVEWRNRGAMMLRSDMYDTAYDDYRRAVAIDPNDRPAAEGFVRAARMAGRIKPALEFAKTLAAEHPESGAALVSLSKLLAANGEFDQAIETARRASRSHGSEIAGIEQLASLLGSLEEVEQLEPVVEKLQRLAPGRAVTHYYGALAQFLRGNAAAAVEEARRAVDVDPQYAAVYDLLGAAYAKLGQPAAAREAFETSLGHNARDSTAYANLGLLELQASNREAAANYFAEALWLDPLSDTAKQGLAQTRVR
jgi:Flp pilus assembly protein TadD